MNRHTCIGIASVLVVFAATLNVRSESKEEALASDPFEPKKVRVFLQAESGGRPIEIREHHIEEWERCQDLYLLASPPFARKRGANQEYGSALAHLDQMATRMSEDNPFRIDVLFLKSKALARLEKTTETRLALFAMMDRLNAVRKSYQGRCTLIDRLYIPKVLVAVAKSPTLSPADLETARSRMSEWTQHGDLTVMTNAWLALGQSYSREKPPDLDRLAYCMGNYYRSLLLLYSKEREPERDFWAVYRDQVRYAYSTFHKAGRSDLAKELVKEITPEMLFTPQSKQWLQEIREARAITGPTAAASTCSSISLWRPVISPASAQVPAIAEAVESRAAGSADAPQPKSLEEIRRETLQAILNARKVSETASTANREVMPTAAVTAGNGGVCCGSESPAGMPTRAASVHSAPRPETPTATIQGTVRAALRQPAATGGCGGGCGATAPGAMASAGQASIPRLAIPMPRVAAAPSLPARPSKVAMPAQRRPVLAPVSAPPAEAGCGGSCCGDPAPAIAAATPSAAPPRPPASPVAATVNAPASVGCGCGCSTMAPTAPAVASPAKKE